MARRKRTNTALPEETLERARQQAEPETEETETESVIETAAPVKAEKAPISTGPRSRRRSAALTAKTSARRERKIEEMSMEQIEELLHNPVKIVTEAELREQYGYVLNDLRNMGLLAAALFVALIVLAAVLL